MNHRSIQHPVEWARRVNRSWIVHHQLDTRAEAWLDHLAESDDGRLDAACLAAREMCDRRGPESDPKPWFYAGLFSPATASEARRFLALHPLTLATAPAMAGDVGVLSWMDHAHPDVRLLVGRLRAELAGDSLIFNDEET